MNGRASSAYREAWASPEELPEADAAPPAEVAPPADDALTGAGGGGCGTPGIPGVGAVGVLPGGTGVAGTGLAGGGAPGITGVGVAFGGKGMPGKGGTPAAEFDGGVGSTGEGAKVCPGPGTALGDTVALPDAFTFGTPAVTLAVVALPEAAVLLEGGPAGGGVALAWARAFNAMPPSTIRTAVQPNTVLI